MASRKMDYSEDEWFGDAADVSAGAKSVLTAGVAMRDFLRRKTARRKIGEDPAAKTDPRVYWHQGKEKDFYFGVPELPQSPELYARQGQWSYEQPQATGEAIADWTLSGEAFPRLGVRFRVFDLKAMKWIGSGRIDDDRDGFFAILHAGRWADFFKYQDDCSGLALVIFDEAAVR